MEPIIIALVVLAFLVYRAASSGTGHAYGRTTRR
jgi:hypothetical protein